MKSKTKIVGTLAGIVVLVILGAAASLLAFKQVEVAAVSRSYSSAVIRGADDLISELKDAETGQRGFVLTGNQAFLEPYYSVRGRIGADLEKLRSMATSPSASEHLDAAAPLINAKMEELARIIDIVGSQGREAAAAEVSAGLGKRIMDDIRAQLAAFVQIEESTLSAQEEQFQSQMRFLFLSILACSALLLVLTLLFSYLVYREGKNRLKDLVHAETKQLLEAQKETSTKLERANASLHASEEKLSVIVHSIGDGLIATDAEGRVTYLNPVAEQLTGWMLADATKRPIDEIFRIVNHETRLPCVVPVVETLAHGTIQGLANHTILIAKDGSECAIADSCAPMHDRDNRVVGAVLVFRDVTKEFAAQQSGRDSVALIQTILNSVADGIVTLQASDGVIETTNPGAERMFGYTAAELIGRKFSTIIPELGVEQRDNTLEFFGVSDEARAAGIGREVVGRRKDGAEFPVEIAVSEMWLSGQRHFTGILRDITARKQTAEALLKAGALQSAIFNSENFSSIATDENGVIQIFNVGAERMLGYTAAEVLNKITPADISDPQEVIARAKALSAELKTPITPGFEALVFKASRGIEDIYELTYIRKDGSRFPAVVSVTALRDAKNAIIGFLLIGTDNTARKQVEAEQKVLDQRLRDQQFYTRSLIESNIDAIMTTNPSGIITDVNKQMEALTGCSRDELIGAPFKDFFTDSERAESGIKLVLSEKSLSNYELTARARDGRETVVSYNASTFYDRDRRLQGVFAAARDVTERKHFEHALQESNSELQRAKAAAEKANLAKSDFLSNMSHELRSPLNAILGFAQLMESSTPAPTPSQAGRISQILQAGWHLLNLINEILDLAVIESGRVSLSLEPVSLSEILSECREMMDSLAQKRGIIMTFPSFELPSYVKADRTRLKQIVINLVSNAIKYNKENGTVVVDCVACGQDMIRISVKDSGAGLKPEKVAQLFQPFNRLGQEAGSVAGTGIGLVVTKKLAELIEGNLGAESTFGTGSVFWVDLPASGPPEIPEDQAEHLAKATPQSGAEICQRTLLYIEDNPANMTLVEEIVSRLPNLRLLTAVNGTLGISIAHDFRPDVILMDINLPGISGIDAMKMLLVDPLTAHIPVVALSANAMQRDIEKGLEAGFFRYITKPIRIKEFTEALDEALEFSERGASRENGVALTR